MPAADRARGALYGLAIGEARAPGMIRAEDRPVLEPWAHRWYERAI